MLFDAARAALTELFSPAFRAVFMKSLGLTIAALMILWLLLHGLFDAFALPWMASFWPGLPSWADWLGVAAAIVAGLGLAIGLAFLIGPVAAIIAGFFIDDVAEAVERKDYPADPPGRAMPLIPSIILSVKFFGVIVAGNILALVLLLVPGVNFIAFFAVNGYLLGRQFFEFAAMRFLPEAQAKALRRQNALTVFLSGLIIAVFLAIPLLNLLTPLFAAALMVHVYKAVALREKKRSVSARSFA
ncbi:MAG TPA: sulfate transporter family protein [Rhizobiaceae bacterium]|nr:sulfate transporter family protein [Rhizobiaceae bacterium]